MSRFALIALLALAVVHCHGEQQVQMPDAAELQEDNDLQRQVKDLQRNVSDIWTYIHELRDAVSNHLNHLRQHQVVLESSMHKMEHLHESEMQSSNDYHHHSGEHSDDHHSHSGEQHSHGGEHSHSGEHHSHGDGDHHSHSGEHHSHGDEHHSHGDDHHSHGDDHGHYSHSHSHSHSTAHDHSEEAGHSHGEDHDHHHQEQTTDSVESEDFQQRTQQAVGPPPVSEPVVVATDRRSHSHHHHSSRTGGMNLMNENSLHSYHHHHHDSSNRRRNRTVEIPKYTEYGLYHLATCDVTPNRAIPEDKQQNVMGSVTLWQKKTGGPVNFHVQLQGFDVEGHHGHHQTVQQDETNDTPVIGHKHGFHIHSLGDLSNGCQSTGPHYNPKDTNHGGPNSLTRHLGDLGMISCDDHGNTNILFSDDLNNLRGPYSIIGKSLVIHALEDDLGQGGNEESLKTGNAGTRIACCLIRRVDKIPMRQYRAMKYATQRQNR